LVDAPDSNLLVAVSPRFVLSRQVLICIAKIGRACRSVPFNTETVVAGSRPFW
jgi:hypothetical protein